MADMNKSIQEFEKGRVQLAVIENQMQNLQVQTKALEEALDELKGSKEEKVYKAVGSILILSDSKKVEKELKEQKETIDLRIKSVKKQEDAMMDKLNKLKVEIEASQRPKSEEAPSKKPAN